METTPVDDIFWPTSALNGTKWISPFGAKTPQLCLLSVGVIAYYRNNAFVVQRVKVEDIELLKRNKRIDFIFEMKLDFGWRTSKNLYDFNTMINLKDGK